jgi:PhnB protein
MAAAVKPIPDGYHTITPYIRCRKAEDAIEFYKKAFGAKEMHRMVGPDGGIAHAELQIGDSRMMLGEEMPKYNMPSPQSLGGTGGGLFIYVADADAAFARAVAAGATVLMPLANMFWGDRYGKLADPFGHEWAIGQHIEDLTEDEIKRRGEEEMKKMAQPA